MKFMRKILTITVLLFSVFTVFSCAEKNTVYDDKLKVVTTIFPQYDFAGKIGGEKVEVIKLLPDGSESHTYEPSIKDMTQVTNSDLFIFTGKEMEAWAFELVENSDIGKLQVLDLSQGITLLEGIDDTENHSEAYKEHFHDYDAHIWTSPENAIKMADNICNTLCGIDPENSNYYKNNADVLKAELENLSEQMSEISKNYDGKTLYFGGRFAFRYLFEEYGLKFRCVYSGCGEETEPSIRTISEMISEMKKSGAKYIFYEEMSQGKIAKSIADETGASLLLLHSCHNLSADESEAGEDYISIMKQNIKNLKTALE